MDDSDESWFGSGAWGIPRAPSGESQDGFDDPSEASAPEAAAGQAGPSGELATSSPERPFSGSDTERYERGSLLGRGGMGRVTAAWDHRLQRTVALKEMELTGDALERRFTQEARITARLEHPGIVPIFDAGITAAGAPYYAMRLLRGESLAQATGTLSLNQLLRHFRDACEAVAYAHAVGVVHQDLKPANIMVGAFGETQVVDWGLARELDEPATGAVGTPGYMAPEQARGEPTTLQSDVFGLGATLFELLCGEPLRPRNSSGSSPASAAEAITPERLACLDSAPRALSAIARRALENAPKDRYPNAGALAGDVTAWLEDRRVVAHDYTLGELLMRFARRWRVALGITAVAVVALVVLAVVFQVRTVAQRDRALEAESVARAAQLLANQERARADQNLGRAILQRASRAAEVGARAEGEILASHALKLLGDSPEAAGLLARFAANDRPALVSTRAHPPCRKLVLAPDSRTFMCLQDSGSALVDVGSGEARWESPLTGETAGFILDAGVVLVHEATGLVHRLSAETGRTLGTFTIDPGARVHYSGQHGSATLVDLTTSLTFVDASGDMVAFPVPCLEIRPQLAMDPAGERALVACRDGDLSVFERDGSSRKLERIRPEVGDSWSRVYEGVVPPRRVGAEMSRAVFAGKYAVVGTWKGDVFSIALDAEPGAEPTGPGALHRQAIASASPVAELAASPSGARVAVRTERQGVAIWEPDTGLFVARLPADPGVLAMGFPDEHTLITVGERIRSWRLPSTRRPTTIRTEGGLAGVAWSASGSFVALAGGDGLVEVLDAETGGDVAVTRLHQGVVKDVAFHPKTDHLITTGNGPRGPVQLSGPDWTTEDYGRTFGGRRIGLLDGGITLVLGWTRALWTVGPLRVGNFQTFGQSLPSSDTYPIDLSVSTDGRFAAVLFVDGSILRFSVDDPGEEVTLATVPGATSVEIADGGATLVVGEPHQLSIIRGDERLVAEHPGLVDVALAPDGARIATGGLDGRLRIFEATALALELVGPPHRERIAEVRFSPDGRRLVTVGWDKTARFWGTPDALARDTAGLERAWGLSLEDAIDARFE